MNVTSPMEGELLLSGEPSMAGQHVTIVASRKVRSLSLDSLGGGAKKRAVGTYG